MSKERGAALTQTMTVKRDEHEPESLEVLAASIIAIADAHRSLTTGPLSERAVLVLLKDLTGLGINDIQTVIRAIPKLRTFVRIPPTTERP